MTTLAQVCKSVVESNIDHEYIKDCGFTSLKEVYNAEYGYNGASAAVCKDYLQGLPSACTIPFTNHDILELLKKNGISRKTETAEYNLIDSYWETCGKVLHKMIK